ncbi:hypothetical protein GCM10011506_45690 [Marivirga lumbricoides]|uniref:D-glucuronyl C5-epimerase C-terminal domain-containing protein n=1 Tax=Marivirga lumbricoides TaxID=1046115 RepID=A0ABQ1NA60_9BACT|nr:hypothetical protein GCM10011506_45690 [Marivirga lumbricoides]
MKYFKFILIAFITLIILRINLKLHSENYSKQEVENDIVLQLNFLEDELKSHDLAGRMQQIFPEGNVFINALYGLSWCELALASPGNTKLTNKALNEALFAYNSIDSDKTRLTFPNYLNPENGIFYDGWRNYLLSKILLLKTSFENKEKYLAQYKTQSNLIATALEESKTPYLQSYAGHSWPADMFVAMASLSHYQKVFDETYAPLIKRWLTEVKNNLDTKTGLIPHKVDFQSAHTIEGARGCSIGLILRMLGEIDYGFAEDQFKIADSLFIETTFGLPSMREYPVGEFGLGDIDSGPVIFGVGFSGTIVMIGTLAMYGEANLAEQQYKTIHAFGFDKVRNDQKKYLFGILPMADAFIAWGRATMLNYYQNVKHNKGSWYFSFHLYSLLFCLLIWLLLFRKRLVHFYKTANKVGN